MNIVVAVVVTYNRIEMLKQCIQKLRKQTYPCDILVVDNASSDGTGDWLSRQADILYFNTGENIGGAGGFNYGMRKSVELGYEFCWVMDDDCLPEENCLRELMAASNRLHDYGWLSSKCLWTDGSLCKMNVQRSSPYRKIRHLNEPFVPAQVATFVSLLIKTEIIQQFGLPIKEFFIWADDWEYTRRMSLKLPCYVVTDSIAVHAMKSNIGSNIATDDVSKLDRYKYAFRNEFYYFRREGFCGILYYTCKCFKAILGIIALSKHKAIRLNALFCSWKDFFIN